MMRNKSTGRPEVDPDPFIPRKASSFDIGPNSHPSKVQRWMNRAEFNIDPAKLAKIAKRHVHPRHKRNAA
jgi:hypothetical protein